LPKLKIMRNLKKYAMILVALVIATTSMTLMSFSFNNDSQNDLHWYVKVDGQWQEDIEGQNPSLSCPGGTLNPCAKGFTSPPTEPITDMTPATETRYFAP
jgi:hypothetical protein